MISVVFIFIKFTVSQQQVFFYKKSAFDFLFQIHKNEYWDILKSTTPSTNFHSFYYLMTLNKDMINCLMVISTKRTTWRIKVSIHLMKSHLSVAWIGPNDSWMATEWWRERWISTAVPSPFSRLNGANQF